MAMVAEGGGGGAVRMDPGAVKGIASRMSAAADRMDGAGSTVPGSDDLGLAGPVLATVLARFCEAGARIGLEADTLAETVLACHDSTVGTDQGAAERFLVTGEGDE